jgi:hypothetical protein
VKVTKATLDGFAVGIMDSAREIFPGARGGIVVWLSDVGNDGGVADTPSTVLSTESMSHALMFLELLVERLRRDLT